MRRWGSSTDLMLIAVVLLWALNITVSKYILSHGFLPLAFGSTRYAAATAVFVALTIVLERTLAIGGRESFLFAAAAALVLYLNQLCFVYALKLTTATTVALILGAMPIFGALFAALIGLERMTSRFWTAASVSFAGVALVALGSGGGLSVDLWGDLIAVGVPATWAAYSVAVAPLMRRYSPYRISAVVLLAVTIPLMLTATAQLGDQDFDLGTVVWLGFAFAVLGPLVLTNVLWFTAVHRVGPSRATLFANLQPFVAALIAVLLLSESLSWLQVLGGIAIAAGLLISRRRPLVAAPAD